MKKRKYLKRLIEDYKGIISDVEQMEGVKEIKSYLEDKGAECGVCKYSSSKGIHRLYDEAWVAKYDNKKEDMWAKRPRELSCKKSILKSLNVRLTNLETELSIS